MKSLKKLLFILVLGTAYASFGQDKSVGINTSTPNSNAVLELVSLDDNQGFLVPRLSTIQRQAMAPPNGSLTNNDNGLMVYDTNEGAFYYWKDGSWVRGLGIFSEAQVFGDLTGEFPNLFLRGGVVDDLALDEQAVTTTKIQNNAVTNEKIADNSITTDKVVDQAITGAKLEDLDDINPGTYGNEFTIVKLTIDKKGRIVAFAEEVVLIKSENIEDLSLLNEDIANGTITISKLILKKIQTECWE